jgi:hypothetical protein
MPATEQTWRDQKKLHVIFAVSSVIMLFATMWMFTRDSDRPWKDYQRRMREIDQRMSTWRSDQFSAADYLAEHERLQEEITAARAEALDDGLLEEFTDELENEATRQHVEAPSVGALDVAVEKHEDLAKAAAETRKNRVDAQVKVDGAADKVNTLREQFNAAEKAATASGADDATKQAAKDLAAQLAEATKLHEAANEKFAAADDDSIIAAVAVGPVRDEIVGTLSALVKAAKFSESRKLKERKFKSADLDKLKAALGLGVSAGLSEAVLAERQLAINDTQHDFDLLTLEYEKRSDHRKGLGALLATLTANETEAKKKLADHQADADRMATAFREKRATWTVMGFLPGKKVLELPILDAFMSPLRIENHWADGLTQSYNFSDVRRFDRCVTCHQAIEKTMPGSAVKAGYESERTLRFALAPGTSLGDEYQDDESLDDLAQQVNRVRAVYGFSLADEGLIERDDVTVRFVRQQSLAAQAREIREALETALLPDEFRPAVLHDGENQAVLDVGLLSGDVLEEINGDVVGDVQQAVYQLLAAADADEPLTLTIRRGLPNPFTSHPKLDLYIGSLSPHKLADFACTICHEGQGSATDFNWASHTPDDPKQQEAWRKKYGWFDNHHWIFPMLSNRFIESTCLKCHHEVVELEPSERFPDPPAPKLIHGRNLIRKFGCYGCHEINGFDGKNRVGPDVRAEPNYFAAAQALQVDPGYDKLTLQEKSWIETLIQEPERDDIRRRLLTTLRADEPPTRRLSDNAYTSLLPTLGDLESPGELTKPGPSLRFVGTKLDSAFLYNWIWNPRDFRATTRMPRFLGLWDHLKDDHESLGIAEKFEPMEAFAMGAYLKSKSQPFEYLEPPAGINESTTEEKIIRGKVLFEDRGCLACHSHADFPELAKFRAADTLQQGPDLTGIGDKFDPTRNPNGRKWLYSWIKKPNLYHVRTVMPNLYLNPIEKTDTDGNKTVTDPADDIAEYLMRSRSDWDPGHAITELNEQQLKDLDELALEHLKDAASTAKATDWRDEGIPADVASGLKGAEKELAVEEGQSLTLAAKLNYVGRKSINKYGCFGCHDIPGFEDAKPIGTGLADWGRKEPAKLAFEHIGEYLSHGHGTHGGGHATKDTEHDGEAHDAADADPLPEFYANQIGSHNRIGFLYQKLREPRGYDYHKALNKKFNERLRMPQFPFGDGEREAVMTFVLGLVAEPPSTKYLYKPSERMAAIINGRKVLEKYNCAGCHVLEGEKWEIAYSPDDFEGQNRNPTFPFAMEDFSKLHLAASAELDASKRLTATLEGMPTIENDGFPRVFDFEGEELYEEDKYTSADVIYSFDIWKAVALNGNDYQVGNSSLQLRADQITNRRPSNGGVLAKYLLPRIVARELAANPNAKGSEAWGWLPPPLVGQGAKVQTEWLHSFLLDPHPIRPAVVLRMPNFEMSSVEARNLANYFAAIENVEYPYSYNDRRQPDYLNALETTYVGQSEEVAVEGVAAEAIEGDSKRLNDAMKIITSSNYCVKCHIIGDYVPAGADRAKAPDLAVIYKRLRPDYVRKWVGKPNSILPYTSMPVNVPYNPDTPFLGSTVPQDLYHGTSVDQVEAIVDLLMNFDDFAKQRSKMVPLVEKGKVAPPVEENAVQTNEAAVEAD